MARARLTRALTLSVALSLALLSPTASSGTPSPPAGLPSVAADVVPTAEQRGLTLTRVSPVIATPGEPVTISGLLDVDALGIDLTVGTPTPPGGATQAPAQSPTEPAGASEVSPPPLAPVATVEVRLGGRTPQSREGVADWLDSDDPSQGRVLASTDVVAAPDTTIDRIPFALTIGDVRDRMRGAYGILPVSVEVSRPGIAEPVGVLRTFVGYQVRKEYEPLQLTWVVPFTVPADVTLIGEFGQERLAAWEALLGEGGALRERLASASDRRVVWALDPALLGGGPALEEEDPEDEPGQDGPEPSEEPTDPSTTMAPTPSPNGTTATPPGTDETPQTPQTAQTPATAERLLRTEFAGLLLEQAQGRDVLLLPTHDADVAALPPPTAQDHTAAAVRALIGPGLQVDDAQTLLTDAGADVFPTAWPANGGWSLALDATLSELSRTPEEPWSVLASTASLAEPVRGPFPSATGATVRPYDERLSGRANTARDEAAALPAALALAADSLVLLNERPGTTRHLIVVLDRDGVAADLSADITAVLEDVPWLELTGVAAPQHDGSLIEDAPAAPQPTLLADGQARDLATALEQLPVAASVRADTGVELATRGADTLAQLTSVRWRGHGEVWTTAYAPIAADVSETFAGLSIPSRDISFLADSGVLRVTVENGLDTGIENATLDLTVAHPILRIESGPQPVVVGAGSRSTVGFQATAIASGRVSVTATLRAADGTVLGEPTEFSVRVSPTSDWIYWVLGALAALVIAVGVARMVLRRRPSA